MSGLVPGRHVVQVEREGYGRSVQEVALAKRERKELSVVLAEVRKAAPTGLSYVGTNDKGFEEYRKEIDGSILILVPAGEFIMGSTGEEIEALAKESGNREWWTPEHPRRSVALPEFFIGKCEVTNGQFAWFVKVTGYRAEGKWEEFAVAGRESHPVVNVSWNDAAAYCRWAGLRLPAEAEWEKAARGADGRKFPWGAAWNGELCNNRSLGRGTKQQSKGVFARIFGSGEAPAGECIRLLEKMADINGGRGTLPVGSIPAGASPFGCLDMAGNVWEWCNDWYNAYPGSNCRSEAFGEKYRVLCGGSWYLVDSYDFRCASRLGYSPVVRYYDVGFRVCSSPPNTR